MASRKDQLQSYQFLLQRVVSAVVMRETDPAQAPLRRGISAVFVGLMISVIVAAGFGVYGLLTKIGSGRWATDGAVVVEKETGAAYVYRAKSLTPALNYTSALLLSGQTPPKVFSVSRNALTGIRRGITRGIPGAPNALPDRKKITAAPWTLCSIPGQDEAGNRISTTGLAVGRPPRGGRLLGKKGFLVADSRSRVSYLVWNSHRFQISSPSTVIPSLFGAGTEAVTVGTAWLNGLPLGENVGPINVPNRGAASHDVPGRRNGDLIFDKVGTGDEQHYLVFDDGLAPVTKLQKDILIGQFSMTPQEVPAADVNRAKKSGRLSAGFDQDARAPVEAPRLAEHNSVETVVCAVSRTADAQPEVIVDTAFPNIGPGTQTGSQTALGGSLADFVAVPAGQVAVVRAMASPSAPTGAYSIVTDIGIRYAVPSGEALATLGYAPGDAVEMPASLVNRIPAGPTLSRVAAARAAGPD